MPARWHLGMTVRGDRAGGSAAAVPAVGTAGGGLSIGHHSASFHPAYGSAEGALRAGVPSEARRRPLPPTRLMLCPSPLLWFAQRVGVLAVFVFGVGEEFGGVLAAEEVGDGMAVFSDGVGHAARCRSGEGAIWSYIPRGKRKWRIGGGPRLLETSAAPP